MKYIGIRAHFFSSECKENRKRICVTGELKDTFERIVCIRFEDQDRNAPDIWWKQPKNEDMVDIHDEYIGIPKNRIMLLK